MLANIPATQTVIEIKAPGGPEMLVPATRPVPEPKPGEVLIRIAAAGIEAVNRPSTDFPSWIAQVEDMLKPDRTFDHFLGSRNVGAGEIDLIDDRNNFEAVIDGEIGVCQSLGFNSLGRIDHQQRALAGGQ